MLAAVLALAMSVASLSALSACAPMTDGLNPYSGPSATLDAVSVGKAATNRARIMDALRRDAGYGASSVSWYDVTLAGFNYVDDSCAQYFDNIFKLDKRRSATQAGISALGQTSNAILFATGAAKLTMAVVAQAFGLSSSLVDVVAGTYLYQLPPATTKRFVDKVMLAYREGAGVQRASITSAPVAYAYIRGYLNLCLPATIESELVDHIGTAEAVASPLVASAGVNIEVGSNNNAVGVMAVQPLPAHIAPKTVTDPLPRIVRPQLPTEYEKLVPGPQWARMQKFLCQPVDGRIGQATRKAMMDFFRARGQPRADLAKNGVQETDVRALDEAMATGGDKSCAERGFTSAYEVGLGSI